MSANGFRRNTAPKLGVNIDHVATLREARGTSYPDPLYAAQCCVKAKADGITMHLREDRRHIQESDVRGVIALNELPVNLEMANTNSMVDFALDVQPTEVCLVPENRVELTTEGGLNVVEHMQALRATIPLLLSANIFVSLFIDPQEEHIQCAAELGVSCVELHTGTYSELGPDEQLRELDRLIEGASAAHDLGLQVNAGHGLHRHNIKNMLQIPFLHTLNIGHSIVARSIFIGLEKAIEELKDILSQE